MGSKPNVASILLAIPLLCGKLPVPNELITVAMAKATASHFMFRRRSIKYIGPPAIVPSAVFTRYLCDSVTSTNLVVIPRNAVIHIQNNAAGPPRKIANATPLMLPVPTVPDSAVVNALKCEVSPGSSLLSYLPVTTFQACLK